MRRRRGGASSAWLLVAPAALLLLAAGAWPLARTAVLAFTAARLDEPGPARWVGLEQFAWIATDPQWWLAVRNTLVFTVASVSAEIVLGVAFALTLNALLHGGAALRGLALLPWAIPTVVSAQLWAWMFHDAYGVVNDIALRLGVVAAPIAWLADPVTAMLAIVVADVWKTTPFVTVLVLAALQGVPRELIAAARVDGAGTWRAFWHVTLPHLRPAIAVAAVFRCLDALRVFDLVYVMTSNSAANATVAVYTRQQLVDFQDVGAGSAAAMLTALLVGLVSVALVVVLRPMGEPRA